jgi:hypothetical protein
VLILALDWPAWITAAAAVAGLAVAVVTAGFLYLSTRSALDGVAEGRRTRYGQLITDLQQQWSDPATVRSIALQASYQPEKLADLAAALFGSGSGAPEQAQRDDWSTLVLLANLVESMGVLVDEEVISNELVYKMWGGGVMQAWRTWEPAVLTLRALDGEPDTFEYFQELAEAMLAIRDAPGP